MATDIFFHRAAQLLKDHATYSPKVNAWTIPLPHLRIIFDNQLKDRPPELFTFARILHEGVRRGFWDLDYDDDYQTDIAVFR